MAFYESFSAVFWQVVVLFVFIAAGVVLYKTGRIKKEGVSSFIDLLFYIVTPCVIINSFVSTEFSAKNAADLGIAAGVAFLYHIMSITATLLLFRKESPDRRGILRFGSIFSNCGYFSIPLAKAILGDQGVFLVSIFVVMFQLFVWTYGCYLFGTKGQPLKMLINPGVIGLVLGIPFFFISKDALPVVLASPIEGLSALNSPIAMLIVGVYLGQASLRPHKGDGLVLVALGMRLIAIPAATLAILFAAGLRDTTLVACMIPVCAPPAMNVVMFASKFNADAQLATRLASLGTVLSIIFVPLFISIAKVISLP